MSCFVIQRVRVWILRITLLRSLLCSNGNVMMFTHLIVVVLLTLWEGCHIIHHWVCGSPHLYPELM